MDVKVQAPSLSCNSERPPGAGLEQISCQMRTGKKCGIFGEKPIEIPVLTMLVRIRGKARARHVPGTCRHLTAVGPIVS